MKQELILLILIIIIFYINIPNNFVIDNFASITRRTRLSTILSQTKNLSLVPITIPTTAPTTIQTIVSSATATSPGGTLTITGLPLPPTSTTMPSILSGSTTSSTIPSILSGSTTSSTMPSILSGSTINPEIGIQSYSGTIYNTGITSTGPTTLMQPTILEVPAEKNIYISNVYSDIEKLQSNLIYQKLLFQSFGQEVKLHTQSQNIYTKMKLIDNAPTIKPLKIRLDKMYIIPPKQSSYNLGGFATIQLVPPMNEIIFTPLWESSFPISFSDGLINQINKIVLYKGWNVKIFKFSDPTGINVIFSNPDSDYKEFVLSYNDIGSYQVYYEGDKTLKNSITKQYINTDLSFTKDQIVGCIYINKLIPLWESVRPLPFNKIISSDIIKNLYLMPGWSVTLYYRNNNKPSLNNNVRNPNKDTNISKETYTNQSIKTLVINLTITLSPAYYSTKWLGKKL